LVQAAYAVARRRADDPAVHELPSSRFDDCRYLTRRHRRDRVGIDVDSFEAGYRAGDVERRVRGTDREEDVARLRQLLDGVRVAQARLLGALRRLGATPGGRPENRASST
jgi:hypothetical protein